MCEAMMNSGPRQVKYHAGLNHAVDDDRVGHCQSHWHSNARVVGLVKKYFLTMTCLDRNKVSSSVAGVVIPAPKFRHGALRVEDEWTTRAYITLAGGMQRSTGRAVVRQALSPVLPKKKSLLKIEAQWRSPYR